jgi:hypothetical protein
LSPLTLTILALSLAATIVGGAERKFLSLAGARRVTKTMD